MGRIEANRLAQKRISELKNTCGIIEIVVPDKRISHSPFISYYQFMVIQLLKMKKKIIMYISYPMRFYADDVKREIERNNLSEGDFSYIIYKS